MELDSAFPGFILSVEIQEDTVKLVTVRNCCVFQNP